MEDEFNRDDQTVVVNRNEGVARDMLPIPNEGTNVTAQNNNNQVRNNNTGNNVRGNNNNYNNRYNRNNQYNRYNYYDNDYDYNYYNYNNRNRIVNRNQNVQPNNNQNAQIVNNNNVTKTEYDQAIKNLDDKLNAISNQTADIKATFEPQMTALEKQLALFRAANSRVNTFIQNNTGLDIAAVQPAVNGLSLPQRVPKTEIAKKVEISTHLTMDQLDKLEQCKFQDIVELPVSIDQQVVEYVTKQLSLPISLVNSTHDNRHLVCRQVANITHAATRKIIEDREQFVEFGAHLKYCSNKASICYYTKEYAKDYERYTGINNIRRLASDHRFVRLDMADFDALDIGKNDILMMDAYYYFIHKALSMLETNHCVVADGFFYTSAALDKNDVRKIICPYGRNHKHIVTYDIRDPTKEDINDPRHDVLKIYQKAKVFDFNMPDGDIYTNALLPYANGGYNLGCFTVSFRNIIHYDENLVYGTVFIIKHKQENIENGLVTDLFTTSGLEKAMIKDKDYNISIAKEKEKVTKEKIRSIMMVNTSTAQSVNNNYIFAVWSNNFRGRLNGIDYSTFDRLAREIQEENFNKNNNVESTLKNAFNEAVQNHGKGLVKGVMDLSLPCVIVLILNLFSIISGYNLIICLAVGLAIAYLAFKYELNAKISILNVKSEKEGGSEGIEKRFTIKFYTLLIMEIAILVFVAYSIFSGPKIPYIDLTEMFRKPKGPRSPIVL